MHVSFGKRRASAILRCPECYRHQCNLGSEQSDRDLETIHRRPWAIITFQMKDDIRIKLAREFEERIQTERQVVYILVETRKLMELECIKTSYDVLTFCCDWAVHPKLNRAFSQKVIAIFEDYQDLF